MTQKYTLYYHDYSVCACMVRYTLAIAGEPKDASSAMAVDEKSMEIFKGQQLDESYLCHVNAKGQVPVLTGESLSKPMTESVDISLYMADRYPALIAKSQRDQVIELLKELHALNYFAISFGDRPQQGEGMVKAIKARLDDKAISTEYQQALQYKLQVTMEEKIDAMGPKARAANDKRAKELAAKLEATLQEGKHWLLGNERPSVLDAHFAIYCARLRDVKREADLLSPRLGQYLDHAMSTPEWKQVMQGRKTMIGV